MRARAVIDVSRRRNLWKEFGCRVSGARPWIVLRREMKELAVVACHYGVLAAAQPARASNDSVEDRLDVRGRGRYYAQNLTRRRLLVQRLGQVARALAQLVEQARVLDGDDRLACEAREQLDLLVG